jgi:hypothetical protein
LEDFSSDRSSFTLHGPHRFAAAHFQTDEGPGVMPVHFDVYGHSLVQPHDCAAAYFGKLWRQFRFSHTCGVGWRIPYVAYHFPEAGAGLHWARLRALKREYGEDSLPERRKIY